MIFIDVNIVLPMFFLSIHTQATEFLTLLFQNFTITALFLPFILEPIRCALSMVMSLLSITNFSSINPPIKFSLSSHVSVLPNVSRNPLNRRLFRLDLFSDSEIFSSSCCLCSIRLISSSFSSSCHLDISFLPQTIRFENQHLSSSFRLLV